MKVWLGCSLGFLNSTLFLYFASTTIGGSGLIILMHWPEIGLQAWHLYYFIPVELFCIAGFAVCLDRKL